MSFIQVDLKAIEDAGLVAQATGQNHASVLGGLSLMWAYCWRNKTPAVSVTQLKAFFSTDITAALIDFGFLKSLERQEDTCGYFVCGAEKYLRITEARRKGAQKTNLAKKSKTSVVERTQNDAGATLERESSDAQGTQNDALTLITDHRSLNTDHLKAKAVFLPEDLKELWNETAALHGLPLCAKLSDERKRKALARLVENPEREFWALAMAEVVKNQFNLGTNDRGWKANFDWFLQPSKAQQNFERSGLPSIAPAPNKTPKARQLTPDEAARLYDAN